MNLNNLAIFQTGNTASPWIAVCGATAILVGAVSANAGEFSGSIIVNSDAPIAFVESSPAYKTRLTEEEAAVLFNSALAEWRKDTAVESVVSRVVNHASFRKIAAMGRQAVPMILSELQRRKNTVWLSVLRDITGKWPVPKSHENNGRLMVADWLAWGKANCAV